MSRTQFLLCLFGIFANLFTKNVESRSARHLSVEGIIGGDNAREGQFPYQVSLEVLGNSVCGGSILSARFIITAAHCVVDNNCSFMGIPIKIVAGVIDLNSNSDDTVEVDVAEVFVPAEYDPPTAEEKDVRTSGDIAILKLTKDLNINGNSKLSKVELPKKSDTFEGKKATISGFGYNEIDVVFDQLANEPKEVNGKAYDKMRFAEANVVSNNACNAAYKAYPVSKQHICAALVQRDEDQPEGVCSGDSGGPLVYNGVQIGVVSTSPLGCREDTMPAVYTRVSHYLDFISKVVDGKTDDSIRSTTLRTHI